MMWCCGRGQACRGQSRSSWEPRSLCSATGLSCTSSSLSSEVSSPIPGRDLAGGLLHVADVCGPARSGVALGSTNVRAVPRRRCAGDRCRRERIRDLRIAWWDGYRACIPGDHQPHGCRNAGPGSTRASLAVAPRCPQRLGTDARVGSHEQARARPAHLIEAKPITPRHPHMPLVVRNDKRTPAHRRLDRSPTFSCLAHATTKQARNCTCTVSVPCFRQLCAMATLRLGARRWP